MTTAIASSLTAADIARHEKLGIPAALLERAGVTRVTDEEARELLSSRHPGDLAGLVYRYLDPHTTTHVVTCRLRRDHPELEDGTPKDKYLSAYGDNRHAYFMPDARVLLADTAVSVVIVEAEKSVLAIAAAADRAARRLLAIGTGGCWGWLGRRGKATDSQGARVDEVGPIADLDRITWTQRDTIIVFDSNAATNPKVQKARSALATELTKRGARVRIGELPTVEGVNGPDDLVAVRGDTALWQVIDGAVAPTDKKPKSKSEQAVQGRVVQLEDPEPWPESVDGATLLTTIQGVLERFAVLPTGAAAALTLWTVHTYTIETTWISPLAALTSPTKRCGKSTVLMLVSELARRALPASSITPAALYRAVERYRPTLLLDEAECWLKENEELRGLVNAGHTKRTAIVIRTVGERHEPAAFSTWCPKLLALIGRLPETLTDRAVVIPMRRKTALEYVERLRQDHLPDLCRPLQRQIQRWADDHHQSLVGADPAVPTALHDRAADNWRPLLAIADAAGGEWPARARTAALVLSGCDDDDDQPYSVLLLTDLRQIIGDDPRKFFPTDELLQKLKGLEERPWSTWGKTEKGITAHALAGLLKRFGVRSRSAGSCRGYDREPALGEAWARYLDPVVQAVSTSQIPPYEVSKRQTPNNDGPESLFSNCQDHPNTDTSETRETPTTTGLNDTLTLHKGGSGESDVGEDDEFRV